MSARRKRTSWALTCATFVLLSGVVSLAVQAQSVPNWEGYWIGEGLTA